MNAWEIVITAVGGSAVLFAFVALLIRSLMLHLLSKDLETFKGNLQLTAFEHQVRFTQLHERRASILADLYSKIVRLHQNARQFVRLFPRAEGAEKEKQLDELWETVKDYEKFFERHRIYFDQSICDKAEKLNQAVSNATAALSLVSDGDESLETSGDMLLSACKKALHLVEHDVPELKKALEEEFREILGVERKKERAVRSGTQNI